jgi:hypothetical protein
MHIRSLGINKGLYDFRATEFGSIRLAEFTAKIQYTTEIHFSKVCIGATF